MFGIVINEQGYKVEFVVLNEDKTPQFYELKDDESIIEEGWQFANTLLKAKWTGREWVEGATDEEIKAWQDSQPKPQLNEMQVLQKQMTELIINQL